MRDPEPDNTYLDVSEAQFKDFVPPITGSKWSAGLNHETLIIISSGTNHV